MPGLLHVVNAGLRPDLEDGALKRAAALAGGLGSAPGAQRVLVARSRERLLVATWLEGRGALEAFAASDAHMAFIMQGVAAVTNGMWSAAVDTDAEPPAAPEALWLFGLRHAEEVYEWQVRDLLDDVQALPGAAACGPTFEERDRFRAAGAVCLAGADREPFAAALAAARERWGELGRALEEAAAPVCLATADGGPA